MTAVVEDDIAGAFTAALAKDAGQAPQPDAVMPAPPRKPDPAEVAERPTRPARKPRPTKDDAPRVAPPEETTPAAPGKYAEGLMASGQMVWLGLSLNKGVAIGKRNTPDGVKPLLALPDTRPYAALFRQNLPALAKTWGDAAKQNATVRKYVSKIAGSDGDGSWVLGVAFSSAMFAMGCASIAREENAAVRAELTAKNDEAVDKFMQQLAAALGLGEDEEEQPA